MNASERSVVEAAPAKVNLHLHVTGRRADGYHLLDSLVVFAPFAADRLEARPAPAATLALQGPFADLLARSGGGDNLVLRAANAPGASPAAFTLDKRLPVASGIGGGSADAAAALRALVRLELLSPDRARLLAPELGADVPVCLRGEPTIMSGIGDVLCPAPAMPPFALVLANPGVAVATAAVFRARTGPFRPAVTFPTGGWADATALARTLADDTFNDLEPAAIRHAPVIADTIRALGTTDGCLLARMSGSGATCFGLFADPATAQRAGSALRRDHPDWWIAAGAASPGRPTGASG